MTLKSEVLAEMEEHVLVVSSNERVRGTFTSGALEAWPTADLKNRIRPHRLPRQIRSGIMSSCVAGVGRSISSALVVHE